MESGGDRDERVMELLEAAMRLPAQEREGFLRSQCGSDDDLYKEALEELLWEERLGDFLKEPFLTFVAAAAPFQPQQVVANRFEILREIGEGGMGFVYEAFDRRLQQRIAIKAAKPGFQRLLTPEIRVALHVSHQNVCRLHEIHTTEGERGEVDFLTMELLEGETLSARIARGKISKDEELQIALQLCAGVAEAHRSGILHRDLKAGNVILCTEPDGSCRAVITDFGLASPLELSASNPGGTPGYMAPELWNGGSASKSSDVYALGVIFYQMVTGVMPYSPVWKGASPSAKTHTQPAHSRLDDSLYEAATEPPPAPSTRVRNLDSRWDRTVMRCLALSPEDRLQTAEEVRHELTKRHIPKTPFVAAAVLLLVIAALFWFIPPLHRRVAELIHPPHVRLAMFPFEAPPDLRNAAEGTSQEVLSRLRAMDSGRRTVAFIPASTLHDMQIQNPEQAVQVLGATHALQVKLDEDRADKTVHATVTDLSSHLPVNELTLRYRADNLGDMPTAIAGIVASAFRLSEINTPTLSPAASTLYLQGLVLMKGASENADDAIQLFKQAAAADPHSPLPLTGMVDAYITKYKGNRDARDLESAAEALALAQSMNPDSPRVLLASGSLNGAKGQYLRAMADYRRVLELEPKNVQAYLSLGDTYDRLNMPDEAVKAYQSAIQLDPNYYEPYQSLGIFYYYRGKYKEAADYFRKTVERGPGLNGAYANLGASLIELKLDDEAEKALLKSLEIKRTARALNSLGALKAYQGKDNEALVYYQEALLQEPNELINLVNVADVCRRLKRTAEANTTYRKALQLAQSELAHNPTNARSRAYVGYFSARLGDKDRANQEIAQALALAPADSNVIRRAAITYEALDERDQAFAVLRDATPALITQIKRHPDMADFSRDPRFRELEIAKGGQ